MTLRYSLEIIFRNNEHFRKCVAELKKFYEATEVVSTMQEGTLSYPRVEEKDKWNNDWGMSFEIRYTYFTPIFISRIINRSFLIRLR